jgi:hypothetical protein
VKNAGDRTREAAVMLTARRLFTPIPDREIAAAATDLHVRK